MAGPHAHTLIRDCCNKLYVHSGSGDRGQSSVCGEKTYQQHITAMSRSWLQGSRVTASEVGAAPLVDTSAHQRCTLTIYPVCFAWIRSSHHRRQSWPCQPSPGRSPLWTPHRSGQTSTRCHRTGRCWGSPAGQTGTRSARLSARNQMCAEFVEEFAADQMTNVCLKSNHDQV